MSSTNIVSVGYDPTTKTLEVEFRGSGQIYQYEGVPPDLPDRMMKSESPGRFLNQYVKDVFSAKRVAA